MNILNISLFLAAVFLTLLLCFMYGMCMSKENADTTLAHKFKLIIYFIWALFSAFMLGQYSVT